MLSNSASTIEASAAYAAAEAARVAANRAEARASSSPGERLEVVADGEERDAKERGFLFGFGFGRRFFARRRLAEHVFATLCLGKLVGVRPNVAFPLRGRHERVLERVLEIGIDLGVPPVVVVAAVVFKTRAGVFQREVRGERGDAPLPRLERPLERERRARKQLCTLSGTA